MEDSPFWGEPTPTDVWTDMQKLDELYEELLWDHRDQLEFSIEGNHITIRNRSREGRLCLTILLLKLDLFYWVGWLLLFLYT